MAITSLGGLTYLGWHMFDSLQRFDYLIDAAGEKVGQIFRVPKTGNIDRVSIRVQGVSSSQTLRVGLETLDGSGDPSGTQYGGSSPGTQTSPAAGTSYEVTLATPAAATARDWAAVVVQFDSTAGNLNISGATNGSRDNSSYCSHYTTAWAKTARQTQFSIRYDDGTYGAAAQIPPMFANLATFNSGSTPDERANAIVLPVGVRACGMYAYIDSDNSVDLVLYDSGGTALETVAGSSVNRASTGASWGTYPFAERTLAAGTYYVAIKPGASNITAHWAEMLSINHQDALSLGQNIYMVTRTDAGAWATYSPSSRLFAGLMINGVDSGGGSGFPGNVLGGILQ